jgi:hypothetical protein
MTQAAIDYDPAIPSPANASVVVAPRSWANMKYHKRGLLHIVIQAAYTYFCIYHYINIYT